MSAIVPTLTPAVGAISSCGARLSWLGTAIVAALGVALQKAKDACTVLGVVGLHECGMGRGWWWRWSRQNAGWLDPGKKSPVERPFSHSQKITDSLPHQADPRHVQSYAYGPTTTPLCADRAARISSAFARLRAHRFFSASLSPIARSGASDLRLCQPNSPLYLKRSAFSRSLIW